MADTKATDESDAAALSPADGFAGVQSGADVYITFALVLALIVSELTDDDPALTPDSDDKVPTKSAVKDYVDTAVAAVSGSVTTGLAFTADSTTTDSDPGTGKIRWNNATHASATILYIDNSDADGTSLATLWALLGANTFIRIAQEDDADIWQLWRVSAVVDGTGYRKFTVSLMAQEGGTIANATPVRLEIAPAVTSSSASTTQTDEMISGYIGTVADKTYKLVVKAAHGGTITEATTISESGTVTATFKINTTALGGTANSVSSSETSQSHASSNVFSAGDDIQLTTSSNSTCLGLSFTIKYTRTYS